jgi:ElaB/YqjD/DUF883 family membrane-anchored ribosome-binding protein
MSQEAEMPLPGTFESLGRKLDERPEIRAAEDAVRRAREQLDQAQQYCQQLRSDATVEWKDLRQANFTEVMEKSLEFVRKNPAVGVSIAAILGYFLGRIFRR